MYRPYLRRRAACDRLGLRSLRRTAVPAAITIEMLAPADIELVGPLWKQLMDHVASLPEGLVPVRPSDDSWKLERAEMIRELDGEAFVLVARKDERVAGYAFVCVEGPDPVWYTGDKHALLATLCVDAAERGDGIGTALMDAVDAELQQRGVEDVEIGVDSGNHVAARLYEGRGYRPDFRIYYGSPGGRPWACLRREAEDKVAGLGRFAPPGPEGEV
jgi:ribosomal protein S18 acetylase RimI-like enzyme